MTPRTSSIGHSARRARRANLLIEFAIVALLLYLIVGGVLTFGRLLFCAQVVNEAGDLAARELARTPLSAQMTFEEARDLTGPETEFRDRIFSEDYLVIDVSPWIGGGGGQTLYQYLDTLDLPLVNRTLIPVMFLQDYGGRTLLRYPGALFASPTAPSGLTVEIPAVVAEDHLGNTQVVWTRVLEEIDTEEYPGDNTGSDPDPFQATSPQGGVAAVRLNFPYQSEAFSHGVNGAWVFADESSVTELNSPTAGVGTPVDPLLVTGPYAGEYGLGRQFAWGEEIRPFRRLISAQSIHRREIFE